MIRIDRRRGNQGAVELLVSGTLDAESVPVVEGAIRENEPGERVVALDLSGIRAADRAGCSALGRWLMDGVELGACPVFLRRWLEAERGLRIRGLSRIRDAKSRSRSGSPFVRSLVVTALLEGWLLAPPVLLAAPAAQSGPVPAPAMMFADARAQMLSANETAKAAAEDVAERREERAAARSLYWPKIDLHGQATHLDAAIELDFDPVRQVITKLHGLPPSFLPSFNATFQEQDFWQANVTATLPLFTGGKIRAANEAAALQVTDAEQAQRQTAGALSSELARRYFGLRLALRARDVRASVLEGLDLHVQHAEALEREGQIARVERMHAEVARSEAARQLQAADHDVALARAALASLLSSDSVADPATGLFLLSRMDPLDAFVARAMANHPGLARLAAQRGRAGQALRAEKAAWMPTVAAFATRELHPDGLSLVSPTWAAGVSASFTLFDGFARGHRVAAAKLRQSRVDLLDARARRDIATLVEQKYRALEKAREEYRSLDRTLELGAEMLRVRQRAFEEGMGTSLEVVDAQLGLQGLQLQRLAAACTFDVALAELLEATGDADLFVTHIANADVDPEK